MEEMTAKKHKTQCHECQLKDGAIVPPHGLNGVTCLMGICPGCEKEEVLLFYACDYNWPDGSRAVLD